MFVSEMSHNVTVSDAVHMYKHATHLQVLVTSESEEVLQSHHWKLIQENTLKAMQIYIQFIQLKSKLENMITNR